MQLPQRRSQQLRVKDDDGVIYLTQPGVDRLKNELERLTQDLPQATADVSRTVAMGDLSENAEYQEARGKLSRMQARIFSIKDRLKRISVIQTDGSADGRVGLGSTVTVRVGDIEKTFQIVGPAESNPTRGRISNVSPLGAALMHRGEGEIVKIQTPGGEVGYEVLRVE